MCLHRIDANHFNLRHASFLLDLSVAQRPCTLAAARRADYQEVPLDVSQKSTKYSATIRPKRRITMQNHENYEEFHSFRTL